MLQEMGITLWLPGTPRPLRLLQRRWRPRTIAPMPRWRPPRLPPPPRHAQRRPTTAPAPTTTAPAVGCGRMAFTLAPRPAYPARAAAARVHPRSSTWLVVVECAQEDDPFAGETGRLLDNMLRALRLHRHPGVLSRRCAALPPRPPPWPIRCMLRPAVVLALDTGAHGARLQRPAGPPARQPAERGGHSRGSHLRTVVLLRAPQAKAAAWADLCRAQAMVQRSNT